MCTIKIGNREMMIFETFSFRSSINSYRSREVQVIEYFIQGNIVLFFCVTTSILSNLSVDGCDNIIFSQ